MKTHTPTAPTAGCLMDRSELEAILVKLGKIESMLVRMSDAKKEDDSACDQVLLMRLGQLTLKRHAVLTASLRDVSYHQIAGHMQCSETTVKLHLKAAMDLLSIPNRSALLSNHKNLLNAIPDAVYEQRFGISKTWWQEDLAKTKPNLLAVLTNTKPTANQYAKDAP